MNADPARIGRYEIVSVLGRGAMGVVYRAHDPEIDRAVAIKLVHAFLLGGDEQAEFIARFRREAQAAARCAHANVVAVYDFALHDGSPFLAMEFVDGVSLSALRQAKPTMAPAQAVGIVAQVLAGLGAAHEAGITHRDVKPANVMLTRTGIAKVADFGISRLDTSSLTTTGMMVGTPSYMSPEQARGERVDGRSDLYSTAVMLYELLAGERPFAGATAGALYVKLGNEDAPDLRTRCPDAPPALAQAIALALARDPARRYATAAAMRTALQAALAASPADERTIVQPRPESGAPATPPFDVDPQLLTALERKLVAHVGPIARLLVQSAVRKARDVDTLCAALAASIDDPAARDRFAREARAAVAAGGSATSTGMTQAGLSLAPEDQERLQTALARFLGPVARVLIKRALPGASSLAALWDDLAGHIEDERDRAAFRRLAR